jgi:flagellar motor switch protein FliN/FliY
MADTQGNLLMATFNQSVSSFLDAATNKLGKLIAQEISWRDASPGDEGQDLQWWSCALTVDQACRFYAGASSEVWDELRQDGDSGFAVVAQAIEGAAAERFGSEVRCTNIESCERPEEAAAAVWETSTGGIELVMSPETVEALGGSSPEQAMAETAGPENRAENSMDMLLHVEIPVSVSLGRTKLRMKELLGLSHGSVVELEQELGDQVEIRVNNCVIAHGEVVAVDGNYGVRILKMVTGGRAQRGLLTKQAV